MDIGAQGGKERGEPPARTKGQWGEGRENSKEKEERQEQRSEPKSTRNATEGGVSNKERHRKKGTNQAPLLGGTAGKRMGGENREV